MRQFRGRRLMFVGLLVLTGWAVLQGGTTGAGADSPRGPFSNSVVQRQQIIEQLQELNAQIAEQNALLRSGGIKVVVLREEAARPRQPTPAAVDR